MATSSEVVILLADFNWAQPGSPFPRTTSTPPREPHAPPPLSTGPRTSLQAAIAQLEIRVPGAFRHGTATALITTGLGGMQDAKAAGISGEYLLRNQKRATWTIRWDYDEKKGCHVNLSIDDGGVGGTAKWAICDNQTSLAVLSASYHTTVDKFSAAVAYRQVDAKDLVKRKECAEQGHEIWKRAVGF